MTDLTRVVIVAPQRTLEMALPSLVPLADVLPVLVQRATMSATLDQAGRGRALTGDGDWVLQRLGGAPLDEELTPASLQVRDGESLYLRPRGLELPPVHFDDLVDGLASGVRGRPDRWRDSMTRAMFLVFTGAALLTCLVVLATSGNALRGPVAAGVAVLAVIGAMMCSRALGDGWAALALGLAAPPFAALAGYVMFAAAPGDPLAPRVSAAVAACTAAVFVLFLAGHHRGLFLAVAMVSGAALIVALLALLGLSTVQAAAFIIVAALLCSVFAPSLAFRLALLRLPQLPTGAADLSEDIEPYPAPRLISGATVADLYLTWVLIAVGLVCTAGVVMLILTSGWVALSLAFSVVGVFTLRARSLTSGWQRGATLLPAVVGAAMLVAGLAERGLGVLGAVATLTGVAVATIALSRSLPGRRLLPHWGRFADFFEYVAAIAMVLLALHVFGVYQWARALSG